MRKSVFLLVILTFLPLFAAAQTTTYTLTQDSCGGKANQYCTMSVTDQNSQPFDAILDTRVAANGPINRLTVNYPYPGPQVFSVHGAPSGFVSNPDGTRHDFYGTGYFVSDDATVNATFNYFAHYQATCSGRGCGGTLGWHYVFLAGSTVEVQ